MKEQFVSYEIALKLKELGFNEECLACYTPHLGNGIFELIKDGSSNEKSAYNKRFIKANAINGCSAPLWQQAIDFILIKYGLSIEFNVCNDCKFHYEILSWDNNFFNGSICVDSKDRDELYNSIPFENKYKAREQAILKAIELCRKN